MRTDEARPLDRYPLVNTSIADEMQAALSQTYAKPAIEFIDGDRAIRTTVNHRQLRHVGLIYASFGASLHLRYPETDLAAQIFSVGGKGEARTGGASVAINRDCSVVISPREPLDVTSDPQFQRLVLTLKSGSLASKLAAIVGEPCDGVLKFDPAQNYALASARALRSHFLFLVETMNAFGFSIPGVALAEFEQTLIVMFLHANRNNYSDLLEQELTGRGCMAGPQRGGIHRGKLPAGDCSRRYLRCGRRRRPLSLPGIQAGSRLLAQGIRRSGAAPARAAAVARSGRCHHGCGGRLGLRIRRSRLVRKCLYSGLW